MKRKLFYVMTAIVATSAMLMTSSCKSDDDTNPIAPIVDKQAGSFKVVNLSYDDGTTGTSITALPDDTLKVAFVPKEKYRNISFKVNCEGLNKLNDSMYVVKNSNSGIMKCQMTADFKQKNYSTDISYSAQDVLEIRIPESYAIIPYYLSLSQDLKELVSPEITYIDADRKKHTFVLEDETFSQPDSTTFYTYRDSEGREHTTSNSEPDEGWTLIEKVKFANPVKSRFVIRYYNVGIVAEVQFRYIPKDNVKLTRERYFLSRSFDRESANVHIPNMLVVDVYQSTGSIMYVGKNGYDGVPKEDVPAAMTELSNTTDNIKFFINENGKIDKVTTF